MDPLPKRIQTKDVDAKWFYEASHSMCLYYALDQPMTITDVCIHDRCKDLGDDENACRVIVEKGQVLARGYLPQQLITLRAPRKMRILKVHMRAHGGGSLRKHDPVLCFAKVAPHQSHL